MTEIGTTNIQLDISGTMYDLNEGLHAVAEMYNSCATKHVVTYCIDATAEKIVVTLNVPATIDGDLMVCYKLMEGDKIHCFQRTADSLPTIQVFPGGGTDVC